MLLDSVIVIISTAAVVCLCCVVSAPSRVGRVGYIRVASGLNEIMIAVELEKYSRRSQLHEEHP